MALQEIGDVSSLYTAYMPMRSRTRYVRFFDQYPQTAAVARQYLFVPVTSIVSEQQFSMDGRLVSKLRSRLDPECVDTLIFLYENLER